MFYRSIDNFRVIPKSVFTELSQKYELSKEQKQFYEDNGFLVVKKLIDFASLYSYRRRFQQICNGLVPSSTHMTVQKDKLLMEKGKKMEEYVVKIQDLFYDEVFSGYFESPVLLDVVSQFLGDDIVGVNSMLVNKPPGTGRHPTHQDMYYFPFRPADKIIATWTAVDDVTVDNGCLFVLPGSHKVGRIYEHGYTDNILKMYHGILDEEAAAPESARVDLEMSPGDTAFFHPLLLHGSRSNSTKNYRKAISGHFAAASCHYVDVTGTPQEAIAREIVAESARRGMEGFTIQKIWEVRSKLVKGVRSHL